MVVIRWKDIFEKIENAIDATESVANILEGIAIKSRLAQGRKPTQIAALLESSVRNR
jgi:hypothetical protein